MGNMLEELNNGTHPLQLEAARCIKGIQAKEKRKAETERRIEFEKEEAERVAAAREEETGEMERKLREDLDRLRDSITIKGKGTK